MKKWTFGSCIRSLRLQKGMTQAQLAETVGVTDKAVSKWERDLSFPDVALFPVLARVLGVTVDDLMSEGTEKCQPERLLEVFRMSGDIRTPLHIILGFAEAAKNHCREPEALERYLEGIRISGEYLMRLLENRMQEAPGERPGVKKEDRPGSGDFPLGQEALDRYLQERLSEGQEPPDAVDFTGRRILIAEDLAINREIASEILKMTGAKTDFAGDGMICLEMVEEAQPGYYDLILMDLSMPNMDGLEAARRIRRLPDPEKAKIPIIALTTNVSEEDQKKAFEAGMDGFVEKPIFVDRLFEAIEQCFV